MKNNKGVTLLELLVAISLLTLIIFAGGGIYLSGWNMFRDAQYQAQAQQNAMVPMAHIVKKAKEGTMFSGTPSGTPGIYPYFTLTIDDDGTPSDFTDDDTINYALTGTQITCAQTPPSGTATTTTVGTHISSCSFTYGGTNPVADITITATDNQGNNPITLNSSIELRYMSAS